ncbi:TonB-dependent siderophore receptor [Acinetobacter sp. VNH17]|uniref:TonB-dependent siderophore receptor n=1 Tax=Acinetobacter thutiue TaxID=2998078 RepID=A0ABT7WQ74_9GAMM|nr:TonB-dependent siderophore receptor [Acinetobacter thutiue]MCY6412720.1 TonB-dependent siderophore receptor [Acinetobacter thutiue]MDN0014827.1 TonB-dependent siderophore receptor [Acinetobacter thutiue]
MSQFPFTKRTPLFIAISGILSISAYSHAADETSQLPTIKIQAIQDENNSEKTKAYTIKNSNSATKLNIEAKEIPQTINVVTRQQMDDFGLTSSRDVLNNTPGVTVNSVETERAVYMARGFEISNILVDGVGFPSSQWNYNDTNPDSFFYDRIEVIKGADALTNAFGDPSATINYVRKRPSQELQANTNLSYGSWNTQRYEADVSGSLLPNDRVRGRLSGFQQTGDSHLDRYSLEKNGIAGVLEADLTDKTLLTVGASQAKNKPNANNWGALPLMDSSGKQLSFDRSYNPNPDWAYWDNTSKNAFIELKQQFLNTWSANLSYNYNEKDRQSQLLYYYGYPNTDGSGISLTPSGYLENNKLHTADFNLQGKFDLLGREHEAIIGYTFSKSDQNDHEKSGTLHDSNIDFQESVYDGVTYTTPYTTNWASWTPKSVTWSDFAKTADYTQRNQSIYAATRLHLTDELKLTLGANYVKAKSEGVSYDAPMAYDESKVSPYAGITYNFSPEYTGYMSYTSIFRPQTSVDEATGKVADPIDGKSYEVGFKSVWLDNRLTGTLAVFRTEENNYPLRSSDGNPLNRKVGISDLRSQGVEVGLAGQLTNQVNVSLGYTQFSLRDLKNGGAARTYNPNQTFNLLTTYNPSLLPKLKVGAGLQWQGKISRFDENYGTSLRQGDYALLNLMASYEVTPQFTIQANADNVTDKKYLNSFTDGQAFYGEPANYTVAFKFKY